MNDDDYATALRQELESLIRECEDVRTARNKGRLLVEHLKAEQASLKAQKDQCLLRIRLLNELDFLQRQAEDKKLEKIQAVTRLVACQQQYNQLLAEAGRSLPEAVLQQPLQEPETTGQEQTQTRKSKSHLRQQQKKESSAPQQHCEPNRPISERRAKSVRSASRSAEENTREKERPQNTMPEASKSANNKNSSRDQRVESSGETRNPKSEKMSTKTRRQTAGQQQRQQQQQRRGASEDNNNKNNGNDDMSSAVTKEEQQHRHSYTHNGSRRRPISSALLNDQMNENEKKDLANFMSACGYHSPSENE